MAGTHVRQVRLGDHLCLPFTNDDEQREIVSAYIADGILHGERVLYFADRTEPAAIDRWLLHKGVDGALAVARGQLTVRSARDAEFDAATVVTGIHIEMRQAREDGYQGLRVTGEMSWALGSPGLPEYESGIAATVSTAGDVAAICQYDERLFDSDAVNDLVALHTNVVRIDPLHGGRRLRVVPTFNPRGLKVVGTVDDGTVDGVIDALNEAIRWPEVVLHLDLAELEFIDVAGVRAIVRLAGRLGDERRLQLDHLKPTLRKVMTIVGWDRAPGLRVSSFTFDDVRNDDLGEEVGSA